MRKILLLVIAFSLLMSISTIAAAADREVYNQEGYLVIGLTTNSLLSASYEYDLRRCQGFSDVHIRDIRYWANNISYERYAITYGVFGSDYEAQSYAQQLSSSGVNCYVKYSGRITHGPLESTGYFVIGICSTDQNEVRNELRTCERALLVNVLATYSTNYEGFAPGYHMIAYGVFDNVSEAKEYAEYLKGKGIDVNVKYGAWKG